MPPLLLGLPGDNTFANYSEANRAFWRQTMPPLVSRVQKSFQAWLAPEYELFRFDYNADRLEALADERASEWTRVGKAGFLTLDEQREALGYGPAPKDAVFLKRGGEYLELRYAPDQLRVPAGNPDGGQWTSGGGGGGFGGARDDRTRRRDIEGRVQTALNVNPRVASDAASPLVRIQNRRIGRGLGETPAQLARESISAERATQAIARVQELDPDWRTHENLIDPENIEHRIARNESDIREADARYFELLRARFGDNMPPRERYPGLQTPQPLLDEFFPFGFSDSDLSRINSLSRDRESTGRLRWDAAATALRLEKESGLSVKRSNVDGADFVDNLGRTWDAVGGSTKDEYFDRTRFTKKLKIKLRNRAADRYVLDLTNLGTENASRVLTFVWELPLELQARITVLR